jgi:DNA-directed RNA polymerase specialized sigma24 family protein
MTDQDTAKLVRRAAAGDEPAWRHLIDGLGPLLCRVSSAYRPGEAEAADARATAWLKLVERIGSLRDGSAGPGWLETTLRSECLARASAAQSRAARRRLRRCCLLPWGGQAR